MDTVETLRSRVSVPPVYSPTRCMPPQIIFVENSRLAALTKSTWSGGSKHSQRAAEAMREQNFMARPATCGLIGVQKSQQVKKIRASLWVSFASAKTTRSGPIKHFQSHISGMPAFVSVHISRKNAMNAMDMRPVWWEALDLLEVALFMCGGNCSRIPWGSKGH